MPSTFSTNRATMRDDTGYPVTFEGFTSKAWSHSPRYRGELQLRGNGMLRHVVAFSDAEVKGREARLLPRTANGNAELSPSIVSRLETNSYARLRGKLYKGSAALGVTLAGYKQSADMIRNRYDHINNRIDTAARILGRAVNNPKAAAKAAASTHLEFIFGVVPLYDDVMASLNTVIQHADALSFVRGSCRTNIDRFESYWNWGDQVTEQTHIWGNARVTQAAGVRIKNANLWLAERAGLLNLGTVAWDIVPWSFLVNMVVNINALVQQVTDFAGLEFDNITVTRAVKYRQLSQCVSPLSTSRITYDVDLKERRVGSLARPSLQMRLPDVSWGTVAMAASLATQKVGHLNNLLTKITKRDNYASSNRPNR